MALTLTGFTDWVKANPSILIEDATTATNIFGPSSRMSVYDNVKSKMETVLKLTSTMKWNDGSPSQAFKKAISGTSGAELSDLNMLPLSLEDKQLSFIYDYDTYALDAAITAAKKRQGSNSDDTAYLDVFTQLVIKDFIKTTAKVMFQGDTTKTGNLAKFDGFLKQIKTASGANIAISTGTAPIALTSASAISRCEDMISKYDKAFPNLVSEKKELYLSNYDFKIARKAYLKQGGAIDKNTIEKVERGRFMLPDGDVTLVAHDGLDGTFEKFLCRPVILCAVTDSKTEDATITMTYDEVTEIRYIKGKFKLGAKVALTSEVVIEKA